MELPSAPAAVPAAALAANADGWLPLHTAARYKKPEAVRLLLEAAPATATTKDVDGSLPLHLAARSGGAEVVRLLLEAAPAAAMTKDALGAFPLEIALADVTLSWWHAAQYVETTRLLLPLTPSGSRTVGSGESRQGGGAPLCRPRCLQSAVPWAVAACASPLSGPGRRFAHRAGTLCSRGCTAGGPPAG